MLLMPSYEG